VISMGGSPPDKLYEAPFTHVSPMGISGVFEEPEEKEILALVKPFDLSRHAS